MNTPKFATWLLQRFRPRDAGLVGDLLEEAAHGRPNSWYWQQVLSAIGTGAVRDLREKPLESMRAVATGWIVLLLNFVLCGDFVAETIADAFWGWQRHTGYSEGDWWPFHVSAAIVTCCGFALSTLAIVTFHRQYAMSLALAYACSVVVLLSGSGAFFDSSIRSPARRPPRLSWSTELLL